MYILLKRLSAKDISNSINERFKTNNLELSKKIEKFETNNLELSKKIEKLEKENIQYEKQMVYLKTLVKDIHNITVQDEKFCPICKSHLAAFLPFGKNLRENAQCPNCGSLERHRASYLFLNEKTNIFKENIKMLHIAPEKVFAELFLAQNNIDYLPVDLDKDMPYVKEKMDIQDIDYPDNTFDFIYCSHVLEHVPNDKKAIQELYRVLKPSGTALISVPLKHSLKETYEDPSINTPELRTKHYGQFDHLRYYGLDFQEKLENIGFKVISNDFIKKMDEKTITTYGLSTADDLFYCTK